MWIMVLSPRIFSTLCAIRKDSQSTFSIECKICDVMGIYGVCGLGTKKAVSIGMSKPNLFSSVLAADRCRCCKNLGFPSGGATPGFRWVGTWLAAAVLTVLSAN